MFNYEDLSDVEFESLAKDIMEAKLGVDLHRFAKGRDGGIDLTDNVSNKQIVIQVKHYFRSSVASLLSSLEKEVDKVRIIKPQRYFVVTSATLSAGKKDEIFQLFQDYMQDDSCVISREDIEDFLQNQDNIQVVKKHFKLWLHSINILELIFNTEIEEDSLVCLTKIHENERILVQTQAYFEALKRLENSRVLFLTGAPGVGKTITAQMLVLKYIADGYNLRFSTDTSDLNALKKSLSMNRDVKEIILLDDCLGQYYFNMKSTQDSELVSLVKFVKMSPKKVLILNSRLTILNEALSNSRELEKCIDYDDMKVHVIDMNKMNILDKARILYNHLYFSGLPSEYFLAVKEKNFYREIILHKNYTPRIIEFITSSRNYTLVSPNDFPDYISNVLNCPNEIWDNEYSQRIQQVDRIFLGTLFSLTDTLIDASLLQQCFNFRIGQSTDIDLTIDHFRNCLTRLNMSMIRVVDDHGKMKIGVVNPSVNDYLANRLKNNEPERDAIKKAIVSVEQAEKMLVLEGDEYLRNKTIDKTILDFYFASQRNREDFIIAEICENKILEAVYTHYVENFLRNFRMLISTRGYLIITLLEALKGLLCDSVYSFYNVVSVLKETDVLSHILRSFELHDLIEAISVLHMRFENSKENELQDILKSNCRRLFKDAIDTFVYSMDIADETDGYDIQQIVDSHMEFDEDSGRSICDVYEAAEDLKQMLEADIHQRIEDELRLLPPSIQSIIINEGWRIPVISSEVEDVIRAALEPSIDDFEDHVPSPDAMMDEIDYMFQR